MSAKNGGRKPMSAAASPKTLAHEIYDFIKRFVVVDDSAAFVTALWVIHTHCFEVAEQTPYLAVTSPERQCGKSRLLEVLRELVARPWLAVCPSDAVVYRHIQNGKPTLLLDEVDTIFTPRNADRYEGLRALLNAGNRRGATVPRCVGTSNKVDHFSTFCPKVLAGIGTLPDTVADRSIPVRLSRRKRDEHVDRFNRREVEPIAETLKDKVVEWVARNREGLENARPDMPVELSDRQQDGCECLVAIASALGCEDEAATALVDLFKQERLDDQESMRVRLLRDLRSVFGDRKYMSSNDVVDALRDIEEAPWDTYYGRGMNARDLATLLRHFGVRPVAVRIQREVKKGYRRDDLAEAWERYE
jgi:hypothetical protein